MLEQLKNAARILQIAGLCFEKAPEVFDAVRDFASAYQHQEGKLDPVFAIFTLDILKDADEKAEKLPESPLKERLISLINTAQEATTKLVAEYYGWEWAVVLVDQGDGEEFLEQMMSAKGGDLIAQFLYITGYISLQMQNIVVDSFNRD